MADFLEEKRREIGARLKQLEPLVDEYARLQAAVAALEGLTGPAPAAPARRPRGRRPAARPAPQRTAAADGTRRGRPKGSGTRATEALVLVTANPGITISEIAAKMGIKQNYLYRVLPGLVEDGRVVKDGRGWRATATV
ncbi:MAG: hypothetical protein QOJ89_3529 [bacterium]|jgi:hypothetical protein